MFGVSVSQQFIARHLLLGTSGTEGREHSHPYRLELLLEGDRLDEQNYLVDIDRIKASLGEVVAGFAEKRLNDLPEFAGQNPSLERFAVVIGDKLFPLLRSLSLRSFRVRLWEDSACYASYSRVLGQGDEP